MQKKLRIAIMSSFIFIMALCLIGYLNGSKISAGLFPDQNNILDAPGINTISGEGPNIEISGDYGLLFQLTDQVSYEPIGDNIKKVKLTEQGSYGYGFNPDKLSTGQGVWVRNAASYNGKPIDMKVVIDKLTFKKKADGTSPWFYFLGIAPEDRQTVDTGGGNVPNSTASKIWGDYYLFMGSGTGGPVTESYSIGDKADFHYEFYDSKTGQKIKLKGAWNFNNINALKKIRLPFTQSDYSSMYVLETADIGYNTVDNVFEMTNDTSVMNKPTGRLTQLFDASEYAISMTKYDESRFLAANYPGAMAVLYSNQSIGRIAPARPTVHGETNEADYKDSEYKKMYYSIQQSVSDNVPLNRNTSFSITSEVPSFYDIETVNVFRYGTQDRLDNLFDVEKKGSKVILKAKNSTSDEFNGQLFDIKIVAKPNATFKFDKDKYAYKYEASLDKGYMNFELGGPTPKTSTHYEYKNKSNVVVFSDTLNSNAVKEQSIAKVRYQATPDANPKASNVELNTDIKQTYPDPNSIIEDLRLDTAEATDDVAVTYKESGPIMSGSVDGDITNVVVVLTTKDGIQKEVTVPITAKEVYGRYTVKFLDEGNDELVKSIDLDEKPLNKSIDLKQEQTVQNEVTELVKKGYALQPFADNNNGKLEEEFLIDSFTGTIIYRFKGTINFKVTDTMPFKQGIVNQAVNQTLPYTGTDDFAISVKDLRSVHGASGEKRGDFSIQASLTEGFKKGGQGGSPLTNVRILYNKSGDESDDVEISSTGSPIYQGTEGNNSDVKIKLDSGNKVGQSDKKGLRLELDKGNNAEKNVTYEATVTWSLIYGP